MSQQLTDELFESHLRFLLTAPSLLADTEIQPVISPSELVSPDQAERLIQQLIDSKPEFEKQLERRRSGRLGIYYETLWGFILQHLPDTEVLAANLPVRNKQRTLGEYDLICRQGNSILHLELAIKFYLGLPDANSDDASPTFQWIGPGLRDRLDIKLQRLFHHQLTLANLPEGKAAITNCTGSSDHLVISKALVQGRLFYPWQTTMPSPEGIATEHYRGDWLPQHMLEHYLSTHPDQTVYKVLGRSEWLTDYATQQPLQKNELLSLYIDDTYFTPMMIFAINKFNNTNSYFFIVPDSWKNSATTILKSL